jgi:glycosyltransferase involved in cell wall biosynthesis
MVHESVDTNLFKPIEVDKVREKYGIPKSKRVILQIATINKKKRPELLIKAFAAVKNKIPNSILMFVGPTTDQNHKAYLQKLIDELNLSNDVMFMGGNFHYTAIPELINCADLLAITSISETGPLPALEAFACGIPIVSTDVGLVPQIIRNNNLGRIVKADEHIFANEIVDMLSSKYSETEVSVMRRDIAREFELKLCNKEGLMHVK